MIELWIDSIIDRRVVVILSIIMQRFSYDDDLLPRVSFETQNRRRHRRASSCCGVPIIPNWRIGGLYRKSFPYDKLPHQPLKLTIRKLDGSSFDVEVVKTATVAELKHAVEGVFRHTPRTGPDKISWLHVWGHFCLCYDSWKLLSDCEPICNYGIDDGDELFFVQHVSIDYNPTRRRSKDSLFALEQGRISSCGSDNRLEIEPNGKKDGSYNDREILQNQHNDNRNEVIVARYELKLAQLLGRWFTYRRLGSPGRKSETSSFSSRFADGFLASFRTIVRLCSSSKLNSQRDPLEEV